ncbi:MULTISPECIES: PadR family transcriptional regulator [Nostocales]|uniref:PadR family transcriptional regulator n=3 Tax=Nostocales TaxID=1161 RepID=A0A0C1RBL1_9CYAN|nr:PadR family transcriptional regulator [Tolypothrix bouteillei]KAF3884547.1 PadR family transcriptional regulator [Tolypothrix bouteillei VB521301]
MFRQFHPRFPVPVHAGVEFGNEFFMSARHGHRGSSSSDWGNEPRTRRGDIKFMLLGLLSERAQHGYELIKELETRRGGFRRLSPGSVYPTLQMLEEGGYLTSEQVDGKRVYTITESGRRLLSDRKEQADSRNAHDSFMESKPSELVELRRTLTELNDAVTHIARNGNLEQANRVRDLLVQVKREIYKFLAES